MSKTHLTSQWQRLRKQVKPRLVSALPHPCPRCGQIMAKGMPLDLGHISLEPALRYAPHNLRLEHRSCNRRHGQRITSAIRTKRTQDKELPKW